MNGHPVALLNAQSLQGNGETVHGFVVLAEGDLGTLEDQRRVVRVLARHLLQDGGHGGLWVIKVFRNVRLVEFQPGLFLVYCHGMPPSSLLGAT